MMGLRKKGREKLSEKINSDIYLLKKSIQASTSYKELVEIENAIESGFRDNKEINERETQRIKNELGKVKYVLEQSLKTINTSEKQMKVDGSFEDKFHLVNIVVKNYNALYKQIAGQCQEELKKEQQRYEQQEIVLKFASSKYEEECIASFNRLIENEEEHVNQIIEDVSTLREEAEYIFDHLPQHMAFELEQELMKDRLYVIDDFEEALCSSESTESFHLTIGELLGAVSEVVDALTEEYDIVFLQDYNPYNYPDPEAVDEEEMGIDEDYYEALDGPGEDDEDYDYEDASYDDEEDNR